MAYTGRLRPTWLLTFFRLQVYERVGKSVVSVGKKAQNGQQMYLMAVTKSRKRSDFFSYSYFKDSGFTEVKRDGKSQTNYVKGVPFVNRRCWKGVPFLS